MMRSRHIAIISILMLLIGFNSCRKEFDEMNINPNKPTFADPDYLFTQAVVKTFDDYLIGVNTEIWSFMVWTQQAANPAGISTNGDAYTYDNSAAEAIWSKYYTEVLINLKECIEQVDENEEDINKYAQARIWRAYVYHRLTDLFGDIPYSEALQGEDGFSGSLPVYGLQQEIYTDLI